jgi:hypothetical protein
MAQGYMGVLRFAQDDRAWIFDHFRDFAYG